MSAGFTLAELPPPAEIETRAVLKQCAAAHRYLAELKGVAKTIPNENILIATLPLLEAKDSSAVENIITTHDELYKEELFPDLMKNPAAKEVQNYAAALRHGFALVKEKGLLTNNILLEVHEKIETNRAGFRKLPGTQLKNDQTGEVVYTPPQHGDDVLRLMANLEKFINDEAMAPLDTLVKMAVAHHQFESIHPFYDGNGRVGRILNILFLVAHGLLDLPVLYLSRFIIRTKADYYRELQAVRDTGNWEPWLLYLLKGIEVTAQETIAMIAEISRLMQKTKHRLRHEVKFYSQDLINNLFCYPYTKIEYVERDLQVTRQTASKYLEELIDNGLLHKEKIGTANFYINMPLYEVFLKGWGGRG